MPKFPCPYLGIEVDLTEERLRHIAERHPDLLPEHFDLLAATLLNPDSVRRSSRLANARLFSRWFEDLPGGKYVVVVVVSQEGNHRRHWIITAYFARRLASGEMEWQKN